MAGKYRRGPDDIERVKKTIYLESDLKERLEALAIREKRSLSSLIEALLEDAAAELEAEDADADRKRARA